MESALAQWVCRLSFVALSLREKKKVMTSGEKEWGDFKKKGGWMAGVNCMESVPEQAPHMRKTQLFPLTTICNMLSLLRGLFSSSIN